MQPFNIPLRINEEFLIATWIRQGRGTSLKMERGYLYRTHESSWQHATSLRSARIAAIRRSIPIGELETRLENRFSCSVARAFANKEINLRLAIMVAKRAGLCVTGTRDWIERHFPGQKVATLNEIQYVIDHTNDRANFAQNWLAVLNSFSHVKESYEI